MKYLIAVFAKHPARFFLLAASVTFLVLWYVNAFKDPEGFKWHDVIVESHGVFFDLFVFGILLSIYEKLKEKHESIQRLHEEIDDYRGWNEKEATYRIIGALRRLNKFNIFKFNLIHCYMKAGNLSGINISGSELRFADLSGCVFKEANLQNVDFQFCVLFGANFRNSNLTNADLFYTFLGDADTYYRDYFRSLKFNTPLILENEYLQFLKENGYYTYDADFTGANMTGVNLESAIVSEDWFVRLDAWQVKGRDEIKNK